MALYEETKKYKTVITPLLETKIRILCAKIDHLEWSGIVFYRTEGSFEEDNLVIIAEDMFLMDKGSAGATEFEITVDIAHYMALNDLTEHKQGLIHSHNNMATFFSGTDQATLLDLGSKQRHFYSLIVNNAGKYTAAITKAVTKRRKIEETRYIYTFGDSVLEESVPEFREEEVNDVHYHLLEIEYDDSLTDFMDRLEEIEKKCKPVTSYTSPYGGYGNYTGYNNYGNYSSVKTTPKSTTTFGSPSLFEKNKKETVSIPTEELQEYAEDVYGIVPTKVTKTYNSSSTLYAKRILKSLFLNKDKISYDCNDLDKAHENFHDSYKDCLYMSEVEETLIINLGILLDLLPSYINEKEVLESILEEMSKYPTGYEYEHYDALLKTIIKENYL